MLQVVTSGQSPTWVSVLPHIRYNCSNRWGALVSWCHLIVNEIAPLEKVKVQNECSGIYQCGWTNTNMGPSNGLLHFAASVGVARHLWTVFLTSASVLLREKWVMS